MKQTISEFSDTDSSTQEEQKSTRSVTKQKIATKGKGKQEAAAKFQSELSKKYQASGPLWCQANQWLDLRRDPRSCKGEERHP